MCADSDLQVLLDFLAPEDAFDCAEVLVLLGSALPCADANSSRARWIQHEPTPTLCAASIRLPSARLPSSTAVGTLASASTTTTVGAP